MKKSICIIYSLFAILFFYGCQNNDDVYLKELKKQNQFLEEQYIFAKNVIGVKTNVSSAIIPYYRTFMKQDSIMNLFIKSLSKDSKENINSVYSSFINQSNLCFKNAQQNIQTKILQDDIPLTQLKNDSLLLLINNESLKNELIKQQVLQRYLTVIQLYTSATDRCLAWVNYRNRNKPEYRLVIEKNPTNYIINLKSFDLSKPPYFDKLEFVSLVKNNKEEYAYEDILKDIKSLVTESKYENDAIILKTNILEKGYYKLYCNKLSISDNGRLIKENAEIDFEIN